MDVDIPANSPSTHIRKCKLQRRVLKNMKAAVMSTHVIVNVNKDKVAKTCLLRQSDCKTHLTEKKLSLSTFLLQNRFSKGLKYTISIKMSLCLMMRISQWDNPTYQNTMSLFWVVKRSYKTLILSHFRLEKLKRNLWIMLSIH